MSWGSTQKRTLTKIRSSARAAINAGRTASVMRKMRRTSNAAIHILRHHDGEPAKPESTERVAIRVLAVASFNPAVSESDRQQRTAHYLLRVGDDTRAFTCTGWRNCRSDTD